MKKFSCIIPKWREISEIAIKTTDKIKKSDFHPDIIIAIARGGLVPGRLFADFLHIKNVYSIKADHWGVTATKDGKARLSHGLNLDLDGKKVLIVDDITDTGESMEICRKHIEDKNPKEVKTATLYHLKNSRYVPDFFGLERNWAWIIFPWNYREDMVNLIAKLNTSRKLDFESLKKELKNNYELEIDADELREILGHIDYLEKIK